MLNWSITGLLQILPQRIVQNLNNPHLWAVISMWNSAFCFQVYCFFFLNITFARIWPERQNPSYAVIICRSGEKDPSSEIAYMANQTCCWSGQHNCDIIRKGLDCCLPNRPKSALFAEPCAAVSRLCSWDSSSISQTPGSTVCLGRVYVSRRGCMLTRVWARSSWFWAAEGGCVCF